MTLLVGIAVGVLLGYFVGQRVTEWRTGRHNAQRAWTGRSSYRK